MQAWHANFALMYAVVVLHLVNFGVKMVGMKKQLYPAYSQTWQVTGGASSFQSRRMHPLLPKYSKTGIAQNQATHDTWTLSTHPAELHGLNTGALSEPVLVHVSAILQTSVQIARIISGISMIK
jgi:hypothetical protein